VLKLCDNCSYAVTTAVLRTGTIFYDNKGNAIINCPKCGRELKERQLIHEQYS
jgi:hypothetical protein